MKKSKIAVSLFALCMLAGCKGPVESSTPVNDSSSNPSTVVPSSSTSSQEPASSTSSTTDSSSSSSQTPASSEAPSSSSESSSSSLSSSSSSSIIEKYTLTASCDEGAEISDLAREAEEGSTVTFHVNLKEEKVLSYVSIDGENVLEPKEDGSYSFTMPKNNVTIEVVTADKTYTNSVTQLDKATISVYPSVCKKGETVTVRITTEYTLAGDPLFKLDEGEEKAMQKVSENTFTATFVQPGKDVLVSVKANEKPADAVYKIIDAVDDGVLVKVKDNAKAGEKVSFTLGLEQGYDFEDEDVEVSYLDNDEKKLVEVTFEDGKYSFIMPEKDVTITKKTKKAIYEVKVISDEEENPALTLIDGENTSSFKDHYAFDSTVTFAVTDTDKYTVSYVEFNNTKIEKDKDNHFTFTMANKSSTLKVHYVLKKYDFELLEDNPKGITLKAYSKKEDGTYQEILDNKCTWDEPVYVKPIIDEENKDKYAVDTIEASKAENYNHTQLVYTDTEENEDGYYFYTRKDCTLTGSNKMTFKPTGDTYRIKEGSVLLGGKMAALEYEVSKQALSATNPNKDLKLTKTANGTFGTSKFGSNRSKFALNEATSSFSMYNPDYSYNEIKGTYTGDGIIALSACYASSSYKFYFYLSGNSSFNTLSENSSLTMVDGKTEGILKLSNGEKTSYALVGLPSSASANIAPTMKKISDFVYKKGTDYTKDGSLFEIKDGETSLGYFTNKDGKLSEYKPDAAAAYEGSLGTITKDGFGNATVAKEGETAKDATYVISGDSSVAITYDDETHYLLLDNTAKTYTEFNYKTISFKGKSIDSKALNTGSGAFKFTSDLTLIDTTSSNRVYSVTFNKDGSVSANNYTYYFSKDFKTIISKRYASFYIFSTEIADQSKTYTKALATAKNIYAATPFVTSLEGNTEGEEGKYYSAYYDGKKVHFGTLSTNDFDVDNTIFTFKDEADDKVYEFKNKSGLLLTEKDDVAGTYKKDDEELVLDGYGSGTFKGEAIEYTKGTENNTIKFTSGDYDYTATLDTENKTFTYTSEKITLEKWILGRKFKGEKAITYYSSTYDVTITFDQTKKTLNYEFSYYYLGSGSNIAYTIGEDNTIKFNMTISSTTKEVTLVFDSETKTLSVKEKVIFSSYTLSQADLIEQK